MTGRVIGGHTMVVTGWAQRWASLLVALSAAVVLLLMPGPVAAFLNGLAPGLGWNFVLYASGVLWILVLVGVVVETVSPEA